jgi:peroxiredoxin/outer membrane lipoprotein-sorting protein
MKTRTLARWTATLPLLVSGFLILSIGMCGCGRSPDAPPTSPNAGAGEGSGGSGPESLPPSAAAGAVPQATAEEVLRKMVQAYKSAQSYRDSGTLQLTGVQKGQEQKRAFPCEIAFERPNKIRLLVDNGNLFCDGSQRFGFVRDLPGQVLRLPAPEQLSIEAIYADFLLSTAMIQSPAQSFSWVPAQLVLLLAGDPLKTLLAGAQQARLLEPAAIDERACQRVEIRTQIGPAVFWIDAADSTLRRFELPTAPLEHEASAEGIEKISMVLELKGAQLNSSIAPQAFLFQVPEGVPVVESLVLPILQVLGQPCPDFQFADLEGKPLGIASLKDKVVVIQLWATTSLPCRPVLQAVSKAYETIKQHDDVAVMAVSLDPANVQASALQSVLKDWQTDLPIYRDPAQSIAAHYGDPALPLTIVVGKGGKVQTFQPGALAQMDQLLIRTVDKLRAGEDVFSIAFEQFEASKRQFELMRQKCVADDLYRLPVVAPQEIPRAQILPRSEPKNLKMTRLWACEQLEQPGNITVVPRAEGSPRILVLDKSATVAELGPDGRVAATFPLKLEGSQPVTVLDTAVAGDGRRYFLGSARGVQRAYLLDEKLQTVLAYPDSSHPGIGGGQLADLDGDGTLEMVLGYFDVVGVQAVDLAGKRIWAERSMVNAIHVAALPRDAGGRRNVLAMNLEPDRGTLVELDWQGKRLAEISLPDCSIGWFAADDLDANGEPDICVLAQLASKEMVVAGISKAGRELWRHPISQGVHHQQIEPVAAGNLFLEGPRQWLIATADGTIRVVGADGRLIESFAYGAELTGMATATWDGKPVLLVSTPGKVEAWHVEGPQKAAPPAPPAP